MIGKLVLNPNNTWQTVIDKPTILDYGAVMNVNTEVQMALNLEAINSMLENTGTAIIPSGTLYINGTIFLKSNQTLIGQGRTSSEYDLIPNGLGTEIIYTEDNWAIELDNSATQVTIKSLGIKFKVPNQGAIRTVNAVSLKLEDLILFGGGLADEGLRIIGGAGGQGNTYGLSITNIRVTQFREWGVHLVGYTEEGSAAGTSINIDDSQIEGNGSDYNGTCGNFWAECSQTQFIPWNNLTFSNCIFQGSASYPFAVDGVVGLNMNNCYFEQTNPVTRPPIYLGRPFSTSGSYLANIILQNLNVGIETIDPSFGIIHCKQGMVLNIKVSNVNLTTSSDPVFIGGAAFDLQLEGINFPSTSTKRVINQPLVEGSYPYVNKIYRRKLDQSWIMAPSNSEVPFGESTWRNSIQTFKMPTWTTLNRPIPITNEYPLGYNTTLSKHEAWDGTSWNLLY